MNQPSSLFQQELDLLTDRQCPYYSLAKCLVLYQNRYVIIPIQEHLQAGKCINKLMNFPRCP
jgi:hypothetical protein